MTKSLKLQCREATKCHEEQEEEDDDDDEAEAISLCDFILNDSLDSTHQEDRDGRKSSSDFFEFFNHLTSEMCHAEDIIFCGKIVPFKKPPYDQLSTPAKSSMNCTRSYRSLDYEKPLRDSILVRSECSCVPRLRLKRSVKLFEASKPRWYGFMFGVVKFSPEMNMRDVKNRRVPRTSGGGRRIPANQRSSWGDEVLNVLSCKCHASVATVAPSSLSDIVPQN